MRHIHQHHRHQRQIIRGSKSQQHQNFRDQPVASFHRRSENALDETICPWTRNKPGRQRDKAHRHQAVSDDPEPIEPRILRADGSQPAEPEQYDRRAKPRETSAHSGLQFFQVKSKDVRCVLRNSYRNTPA